MSENHTEKELKHLHSRLDRLENLIQLLIQRVHTLERQVFPLTEQSSQTNGKENLRGLPPTQNDQSTKDSRMPGSSESLPSQEVHEVAGPGTHVLPESLESKIGGNVLNKIGMVAIILGVSYFLKYAIENQWIGETGRVAIGILVGLGFLAWGEYLWRKSYRGYSITVLGGGIAILYFSIFAAFNFYNLLPQLPALFIMVLVTTTAVVMSVRYDSLTVAVFATVGGFLTPALLSTGKDNQVGLFSYIALLDLGVLSLAYLKNWRGLNLLSFLFTQLLLLVWAISFYSEAKLWRTEWFLTLFFLIFAASSAFYNITHKQKTTFRDLVLISANGALYFLWTYSLFESRFFHYLGLYAVVMAVLYLGMGVFSIHRSTGDRNLFLVLLGLSLTFLTVAIPIQLKQNWISIGWAVEAVILCWIGFRLDSENTRWAALMTITLVAVRLLAYDSPWKTALATEPTFIFNRRGLAFLFGSLAMFSMAYLYSGNRKSLRDSEQWLMAGLVAMANFMILFFVTTETIQYFDRIYYRIENGGARQLIRSKMQLSVSALWGIHSIILVTIGILRRFRPIRLLAILLFAVTILKVFLVDLQEMEKFYRIVASIGLGVILLAVSMMYQKYRARINDLVLK